MSKFSYWLIFLLPTTPQPAPPPPSSPFVSPSLALRRQEPSPCPHLTRGQAPGRQPTVFVHVYTCVREMGGQGGFWGPRQPDLGLVKRRLASEGTGLMK